MKLIKEKISRKEFEQIDINAFARQQILNFLKENKDIAFSFDFLKKKFNIKQSVAYQYLSKLVEQDLISRKKKYYILK